MKHICASADFGTINETLMTGNAKPNLPGFHIYHRNRVGSKSGGIATGVYLNILGDALKIFEGS